MANITSVESIRLSHRAARFEGGEENPLSFFITQYDRGEGPDLHLHPYPETFIVQDGRGVFTVGDEQVEVAAGNIIVVPPDTRHGFKNPGDAKLRVIGLHPSPHVIQTDLE